MLIFSKNEYFCSFFYFQKSFINDNENCLDMRSSNQKSGDARKSVDKR